MGQIDQPPVTDVIKATVLTSQGDIIVRGAAEPGKLAIGTAGQILRVNAGATAPEYTDVPRLYNKAKVRRGGTNQVINTSTITVVQFDQTVHDPDVIWDGVNYRFIPQVAGYVEMFASLTFSVTAVVANYTLYFSKNGTLIAEMLWKNDAGNAQVKSICLADQVYVNGTTDYLDVLVNQDSGVNQNLLAHSRRTFAKVLCSF